MKRKTDIPITQFSWTTEVSANRIDDLTRECARISRTCGILNEAWDEAARKLILYVNDVLMQRVNQTELRRP